MDLAGLLQEKLTGDGMLTGMLAGYGEGAAVFAGQAPPDDDPGWTGEAYPRVTYVVERSEEPQQRTGGAVSFNIWSVSRSMVHPGVIGARLQELLNGGIFHPDNGPATGMRWRSACSPAVDDYDADGNLIVSLTVKFDLINFPVQVASGSDPVSALNQWTGETFFEAQLDPGTWMPGDGNPAVYWQVEEMQIVEQYATASWVEARLAAYVIAPTQEGRAGWVKKVMERLSLIKFLNLAEGSPLFIRAVKADFRADYLRTGQISLTVRYGVGPEEETGGTYEKLNNAVLDVM
ncbi:MAG: hypothetical protein ACOWWO_12055 [Peptococcaceae bacterium]